MSIAQLTQRNTLSLTLVWAYLFFLPSPVLSSEMRRLILQITVDALRVDRPKRPQYNMGRGGLRFLFDEGLHYSDAN
ncbi:MAG: hypothetical protein H6984_07600 [Pseudomonadales bacterium]|nr:hypothetical protein [Pseudomonadales bacterium]MCP5191486.1 hypothetical protein [Pseudomonadales bacterium]